MKTMMSKHLLVSGSALAAALSCWSGAALAQNTTTLPSTSTPSEVRNDDILVTGSRIKRDPTDSSLPLQVITP